MENGYRTWVCTMVYIYIWNTYYYTPYNIYIYIYTGYIPYIYIYIYGIHTIYMVDTYPLAQLNTLFTLSLFRAQKGSPLLPLHLIAKTDQHDPG